MAITAAQLQAQLGTWINDPRVIREFPVVGTTQGWLVTGGVTNPGITKMITTTASDAAATQATTVTTKIKKPNGHD
jgi:hypothetical protein